MIGIYTLVEAIWLVLPAYGANGLATLSRGKRPIDGGRRLRDGRRLFGQGKTWEGLLLGVFVAAIVSTIQMLAFPYLPWDLSPVPLNIVPMNPFLGIILGLGAMVGDIAGSFVKRRMDIRRGEPAPLLDQEDFLIGMFFFSFLFIQIMIDWVIILLILTPALHLIANVIGYLIKVKREPW